MSRLCRSRLSLKYDHHPTPQQARTRASARGLEARASDFTPWLAEDDNLQALAEALGISELELVATEHQVGDFKLDILCTDGDQQVVIEN